MRAALEIHRDLLSRDVPHEVVRLPGPAAGADDLPRVLGLAATSCVAVRCYITDTGFVAVAVHAGAAPDPGTLLAHLRAGTLRTASADEVNAATDYAAALVSPLSLPVGVRLVADAVLGARDVLYCPAGEGGLAIGIRSRDLLAATGAEVVPLTPLRLPRQSPDVAVDLDRQVRLDRDREPDVDLERTRDPAPPEPRSGVEPPAPRLQPLGLRRGPRSPS